MNARSSALPLIRAFIGGHLLSMLTSGITTIPFRDAAAVQLGNVDAACNNDPFLTSMKTVPHRCSGDGGSRSEGACE